jgi:hypothetical protein
VAVASKRKGKNQWFGLKKAEVDSSLAHDSTRQGYMLGMPES